MPRQRQYPHLDGVPEWQTRQSLRLLWDRVFDLADGADAATATITAQAATITSLSASLATLRTTIAQVAGTTAGSGGGGSTGGGGSATGMVLSVRAVEIVYAIYTKFIGLAHGSDEDRRMVTLFLAQQLRFELGPGWGTKKAGLASSQSKDAIAYTLEETDPSHPMDVWDWQNGATRAPQVQVYDPPTRPNVTGQVFIQVVPTNHLP